MLRASIASVDAFCMRNSVPGCPRCHLAPFTRMVGLGCYRIAASGRKAVEAPPQKGLGYNF